MAELDTTELDKALAARCENCGHSRRDHTMPDGYDYWCNAPFRRYGHLQCPAGTTWFKPVLDQIAWPSNPCAKPEPVQVKA